MSEVNPIEAMARAAITHRRGDDFSPNRFHVNLAKAEMTAALTALSENITVEMVEAGAKEVDHHIDALGLRSSEGDKAARFVFRAMLNQAMKEQG